MPEPRAVAVSIPIVLPWLLTPVELAALEIPQGLASTKTEPIFLLCSSRKHPQRFLFPKGGIEKDEDAETAAIREGWEEAGYRGVSIQSLGEPVEDGRPRKHAPESDTTSRATYHFFLVLVTSLSKDWPERHERQRKWCSAGEAADLTSWKVEVEKAMTQMPKETASLEKLVKAHRPSN